MKVDFLDVGVSYKQAIEISNYFKNFGVVVLPAHYKEDFFDFDTEYPIWYGSRVSAKSYVKAIQMLYKASTQKYFRALFTRETQKDARESQYQLFEDLITKIYPFLQDEFYLETSKMRVTHKNGNFLKGASFENLPRSLAEYTDFWVDEPITRKSSISRTDLLDISGTLRNSYGMKSQKHLTFNPISKTTFIYTDFFGKDKVFDCKPLLCNYQHNVFCPTEKIKELEWYKDIDYERYLVDSLGLWGDPKSDRPFIRAINYDKMVVNLSDEKYSKLKYSKALPTYISLDFNEKWTATIKQIHGKTKVYYESLHDYPEELIRELALKYGSFEVKITGDSSGRNNNQYTSDASKKTAWLFFKSEFNKYCTQFYGRTLQMQQNAYFDDSYVTTANIGHDASRTMCNALIHLWGETDDIYFDAKGCRDLVSDFKRIDATVQGGLDKNELNRKDIGHWLDTFRYDMCYFHFREFRELGMYEEITDKYKRLDK